jgi:hypothetical protein
MLSALSDELVEKIFGSLYLVLSKCSASRIHILAGAAGWEPIPDGKDASGHFTRAEPLNAVKSWWVTFDPERKRETVVRLASVLSRHESEQKVEDELRTLGFSFRNGGFVPVNAQGKVA